ILRQIANSLPKPYRFRPAGDLATEIEWARNRRVPVRGYLAALDGRVPPIPADLTVGGYERYERRKRDAGLIDFEELLEFAAGVRLQEIYRPARHVRALANRLAPQLGGAEKVLRPTRPDGPEPEVRPFATRDAEAEFLVERVRSAGCPLEEVAILCRTNQRLA